MHPIQQKAILAMLASAESQIAMAKSMMFMEMGEEAPGRPVAPTPPRSQEFEKSYLHEREEERLAEMMEQERLASLAQETDMLSRWEKQRQAILDDEVIA